MAIGNWGWWIILLIVIIIILIIVYFYFIKPPPDPKCHDWLNGICNFARQCREQSQFCGGTHNLRCVEDVACTVCPYNWPAGPVTGTIRITYNTTQLAIVESGGGTGNFAFLLSPTDSITFTLNGPHITTLVGTTPYYLYRNAISTGETILNISPTIPIDATSAEWLFTCGFITDPNKILMMSPLPITTDNDRSVLAVALAPFSINSIAANSWTFAVAA